MRQLHGVWSMMLVVITSSTAFGQTNRASSFDGGKLGFVRYAASPQFQTAGPISLEAWVYLESDAGCGSVLSHDGIGSYSLSVCPKLRFSRNGASTLESSVAVKPRRWTHVAVSYTGASTSFFIDGKVAGTAIHAQSAVADLKDMLIGAAISNGAISAPFRGYIDEIRIWLRALSGTEIKNGMNNEVRAGSGLVAVFADGGRHEDIAGKIGVLVTDANNATGVAQSSFGILPAGLTVPLAAVPPLFDGKVDITSEYLGAEQIPIRYSDSSITPDAIAYVTRTDSELFVGIRNVRDVGANWSRTQSWVGLLLDPVFGRDVYSQKRQTQVRAYLDFDGAHYEEVVGDGSGGWGNCSVLYGQANCLVTAAIEVKKSLAGDDGVPLPPTLEFRIPKNRLGEWTERDGIAIGHFAVNGVGDDHVVPVPAAASSPMTWAELAYSTNSISLPRVTIKGKVANAATALQGWRISLQRLSGGGLYQTTTQSAGYFEFANVAVPKGEQLLVKADKCSQCKYSVSVSAGIPTPLRVYPGNPPQPDDGLTAPAVLFPSCSAGCVYPAITFDILTPLGAIRLSGLDKMQAMAGILLRTDGPVSGWGTAPGKITIFGENLHSDIEVFLSPRQSSTDPSTWMRFPTIGSAKFALSSDRKSIVVDLPHVLERLAIENGVMADFDTWSWRVVVKDAWIRSNMTTYTWIDNFKLLRPPYVDLYGFRIDNKSYEPTKAEFSAVYGRNAYYCVSDLCVPDPFYWTLWYGLYEMWIEESGGACNGLSATSILMRQHTIDPRIYDSKVLLPAGFVPTIVDPVWNQSGCGWFCGPAAPDNITALVRMHHGMQTTAASIYRTRDQLSAVSADGVLRGSPKARLNEIIASPLKYVICMAPGVGQGHCVTPYSVQTLADPNFKRIHVYDPNHPGLPAFIDVDTAGDAYIFKKGPKVDAEVWSGTWMFTYPLSMYTDKGSMPDLRTLPFRLVFGGADAQYSTGTSDRWGWTNSGILTEGFRGSKPLPTFGGTVMKTRSVMFLPPPDKQNVDVQVNVRGGDYSFVAGGTNRILQLRVTEPVPGDVDRISTRGDATGASSFAITPQRRAQSLTPAVGLVFGQGQKALISWSGLTAGAGWTVELKAMPENKAVELRNGAGQAQTVTVLVQAIDATTSKHSMRLFGPLVIPAAAKQRFTLVNWPDATILKSEIDADINGTPEDIRSLIGRDCRVVTAATDMNRNGVLDSCDLIAGTSHDRNHNGMPDDAENVLALSAIVPPPSIAAFGEVIQGQVRLSQPAPSGGAVVQLYSLDPAVTVPSTVTVPAGAASASYSVTRSTTGETRSATIQASYRGVIRRTVVSFTPGGD